MAAYLSSDQFFGLNVPQPGNDEGCNDAKPEKWQPKTGNGTGEKVVFFSHKSDMVHWDSTIISIVEIVHPLEKKINIYIYNVPFHTAQIENIDEKRLLMRRSTQITFPKKQSVR